MKYKIFIRIYMCRSYNRYKTDLLHLLLTIGSQFNDKNIFRFKGQKDVEANSEFSDQNEKEKRKY